MNDDSKQYRPTALQLRSVARVLADDPSMKGSKGEIVKWFPDPDCRFIQEDHDLLQFWYRAYGRPSTRTDRARGFVHWKIKSRLTASRKRVTL